MQINIDILWEVDSILSYMKTKRLYSILCLLFICTFITSNTLLAQIRQTDTPNSSIQETYQKMKEDLALKDKDDQNGFSVQGHLDLAHWCLQKKLKNLAIKEFILLIEKDPGNEPALNYLNSLDYTFYEGKWMPRSKRQTLAENKFRKLLSQLKSKNEKERISAKEEMDKMDIADKINPLIKYFESADAGTKTSLIQSISKLPPYDLTNVSTVVPFLVKTSLADKNENVKEAAFSSAIKVHKELALHYYGSAVFKTDNTARQEAIDNLNRIPDLTDKEKDFASFYLIATMQKLKLIIYSAKKVDLGEMRTLPLRYEYLPRGIVSQVTIELPTYSRINVSTTISMPMGMTLELAQGQMDPLSKTLGALTGQNFGADYSKWVAWWNKKVTDASGKNKKD